MRARSKAREIALFILYQIDIYKRDYKEAFQNYLEEYPQKEEVVNFSLRLIEGVLENLEFLDSVIKKYIENWDIKRLAFIDRNILRLSTYELLFLDDIPPKVSINEAIELAKRFGDINSSSFVNGILDKIFKSESKKAPSNEKV